jgi:hypothetical protein
METTIFGHVIVGVHITGELDLFLCPRVHRKLSLENKWDNALDLEGHAAQEAQTEQGGRFVLYGRRSEPRISK